MQWDVRTLSLYHDNDTYMDAHKSLLTGRMMDQWWDKSPDAGPSSRTAEEFSQDLPTLECLTVSDGDVKILRHNVWILQTPNPQINQGWYPEYWPIFKGIVLSPQSMIPGSLTWSSRSTSRPMWIPWSWSPTRSTRRLRSKARSRTTRELRPWQAAGAPCRGLWHLQTGMGTRPWIGGNQFYCLRFPWLISMRATRILNPIGIVLYIFFLGDLWKWLLKQSQT